MSVKTGCLSVESFRASTDKPNPGRAGRRGTAAGRFFRLLLLAGLTAACGPLPRPFEHQRVSPLLSDQRALAPIAVQRIDGAPGLAEAVTAALNREEIAASMTAPGSGFLTLSGSIRAEKGAIQLIWQITDGEHSIDALRQPLAAGALDAAHRDGTAEAATRIIIRALRGDDSGTADLEAAPHVALRQVKAPPDFDGGSLARAMARALALQGLTIVSDHPSFLVDGNLQIGPTRAGQNLLTVDWTVRDAGGRELGTVSQGSPVAHERLQEAPRDLARDIADAGAGGIAEVIRKQADRPPPEAR